MGCVNKNGKEFLQLAAKHNVASNTLEQITHKYWLETGNETLYPSDVYIKEQLGLTQYQEPGKSVRKLWEMRYSTPRTFSSFQALQEAKNEAAAYFPQSAIISYLNNKGTYTLTIKQPVAKLSDRETFFSQYDSDPFTNFLRTELSTKNWAFRSLSDKELKDKIITSIQENYSDSDTNLQFAIETPKYYEGNITPDANTIFVFGSNPEGRHGAGAAKTAREQFGAIYGQGEGLQGNAYALPTKDLRSKPLYSEDGGKSPIILYRGYALTENREAYNLNETVGHTAVDYDNTLKGALYFTSNREEAQDYANGRTDKSEEEFVKDGKIVKQKNRHYTGDYAKVSKYYISANAKVEHYKDIIDYRKNGNSSTADVIVLDKGTMYANNSEYIVKNPDVIIYDKMKRSITPQSIIKSIQKLYDVARQHPTKQFKVAYRNTTDATLNGYTGIEMIEMFKAAGPIPSNIIFSKEWVNTGMLNTSSHTPASSQITSQLIEHLKSMGITVYGKAQMEQYLKDHNIASLQLARPYGKNSPYHNNVKASPAIRTALLTIIKSMKYNNDGTDIVIIDKDPNHIYVIDHSSDTLLNENEEENKRNNIHTDLFGIRAKFNINKLTENDIQYITRNIARFYRNSEGAIRDRLQKLGITTENLPGIDITAAIQRGIRDNGEMDAQTRGSEQSANQNRSSADSRENKELLSLFTTPQGEVYGFVDKDGNIYLDETVISPEHPIHEYTHLWDRAIAKSNPQLWKRGITLMQQLPLWNEIANDSNYGMQWRSMGIKGDKLISLIASEVHSRLVGEKGKSLLSDKSLSKDKKLINHLKQWLQDMWQALKDTFSQWSDKDLKQLSIDDFTNMTLRDFAKGLNPNNPQAIQDFVNNIPEKELKQKLHTLEQENEDYNLLHNNEERASAPKERSKATPQSFTFNDGITIQAPFKPNAQQIDALNTMSDFIKSSESSMTLSGYAGTGKTSIMEMIAQKARKQHKNVLFCATTNKAAAVLNSKVSRSGFEASTLNKIFGIGVEVDSTKTYNAKNLVNVLKDVDIPYGTTVIIDEASMINEANYNILNDIAKRFGLKIIYVGDEAQLAPVGEDNISKVFRNGDGKVVRLTQVERTADNAILKEATAIRNGQSLSGISSFNSKGEGVAYISPQHSSAIEDVIATYVKGLKGNPEFFRILAYHNDKVAKYNDHVRKLLGYNTSTPQEGEPMMGYANWGYNWKTKSYRFINSESYKVVSTQKPRTISMMLNGTKVSVEAIPVTLADSLGNQDTFEYIDIKNNPQNRQAATLLANEKKALWAKQRTLPKHLKADVLQQINSIDQFLFVNDNILDNQGSTLQAKVIDFGYAMTVHKSQGSTFTHVLMDHNDISKAALNNANDFMLDAGLTPEDFTPVSLSADLNNLSEKIDLGDAANAVASATTPTASAVGSTTNVPNLRSQLEYVAVSRATDTVTIISNNVKKEGTPLHPEKNQTTASNNEVLNSSPVESANNVDNDSSATVPDSSLSGSITPIATVPDASPSDTQTVSLPGYEYFTDMVTDTTVDAEWKIPYLKELDSQLSNDKSPEQINSIITQMDNILNATTEKEYLQEKATSEQKDTQKVQEDFDRLNKQYDNLFGEMARMCHITATEITHTAEVIMNMVSDEITRLQTQEGYAKETYPLVNTKLDFLKASRSQIVQAIGINTLLDQAKLLFSPKNAQYKNPRILLQARLIIENWDAFISLGAATFEFNEGFGIKRDHRRNNFETTTASTVDVDNFNDYNNDPDNVAENEGKDEQEHWQIETKTLDNLQSMSILVRRALHECILRDENGNPLHEKWSTEKHQVPKRVEPREAMNSILRWTQGSLSLDDMITRLSAKQQKNPWLSQLVERLSDKTGKETDFQSQFYGVFAKAFQPYSVVLLEDGTFKSIPVNDHPALHNAIQSITTLFKVGQHPMFSSKGLTSAGKKLLGTKDTTKQTDDFNLHQAVERLRYLNSQFAKTETPDESFFNEAVNNIVGACHALGLYDITESTLEGELTPNNLNEITKNLGIIVSILDNVVAAQDKGELKDYNPFDTHRADAISSALRNFFIPITDKLEDTAVTAFYDSGKMYQSYVIPSFMTKLMSKFRQEGQAFEDFLMDEYGSSEWFKFSGRFNTGWRTPWLKKLALSEEARKVFDHKVELNFNKHNYMRNMSDAEYTLSLFTEYFAEIAGDKQDLVPAWFRMPMQSNKPSSEFVKFYSYRGSNYKDEIINGLHDIFLQELARIQTVNMRNLSKKDKGFIKNFDTNGRKFNFLPSLNKYLKGSADNPRLSTLLQKKVKAEVALTPQEEVELGNLVDKALRADMENRIQSILIKWENDGIIEAATKVKGIYPNSDKAGSLSKEQILDYTKKSIENFLWNDAFASKNILQLTIGDIAFYKDAEDLQKRLAQLHAPGVRGNIHATDYNGDRVSDGKYRTFILKDFDNFKSNIIANISEVFDRRITNAPDDQKPALRALKESLVGENGKYRNINVTDAQGFSSPSSYRKKALMFGKWSKKAEDMYQKLLKGDYTFSDLEIAFQPLKPFLYSRVNKNLGVDNAPIHSMQVPFQAKNAEYLLIMADAILQGESISRPNLLRAVYRVMEDSERLNPTKGIDTVQFESSIKSSLQGAIDITPWLSVDGGEEGAYTWMMNSIFRNGVNADNQRIYKNYDIDSYVHETSFEDYCLQQEVPEHFKDHSQAHGSQIRMIIPSDLDLYTTDANGNQVDNFYEFDDYDTDGNKIHKKLNANEYKREYEETIAASIAQSITELENEFHLNGTQKERNAALSEILIKEIESSPSRYGVDLIQACSLNADGEFRIPKGDPIQAKRIEQLINSIIKNRVNKQKIAGGPIVQVTNFGTSQQLHIRFNDREGNLIPLESDYVPSEHNNLSYKEYLRQNQGGIAYFEVFIPMWSNDIFKKFSNPDGTINVEAINAVDPELLKMVSYRIPTEDKYSCAPMKAVGFMPKEAGDAIMLPYELTEIDDSDFDVDKRYVMRKSIPIKEKEVYEFIDALEERGEQLYKELFHEAPAEGYIHRMVSDLLKNPKKFPVNSPFRKALYTERMKLAFYTDAPKSGRLYRDNKIVDMSYAVLTNQQTADKILNPGGFDAPKKMGYMVAAYKNPANNLSWSQLQSKSIDELKELSYTDKDLTFADTQIQFYKQNSAAASLIGVFAVNKIAHATLEGNDIFVDINEVCGETPFTIADFTFSGRMQVDPRADSTGTLIGKTLGSLVSASADAVKDPILNLMNINMTTAGMLNSMLRLGMTFDDAALFLSQSIIEKVLDRFNRENLTNYQSLDSIINEHINKYMEDNQINDASAINEEPLTKEELIHGLTSEEHDKTDYKVLLAFQKLRSLTNAMRNPTYATRFNSISSAVGPLIIDNLIIEHKMKQFMDSELENGTHFYTNDGTPVDILDVFSNHPILEQFARTVDIASSMFSDMPAGSTDFRNLVDSLPTDISDKLYNDKRLFDKFATFYQSYLLIQSGVVKESELSNYINGFPNWFMSPQKGSDKTFKELYPDNALIQAIQRNIDKNGKQYLSLALTGKDEKEKEKLRYAWIDLHHENPQLSQMLFNYSFFRAGIGFSPKTFMALVPTFVKEQLKSKEGSATYVDTYRNFPSVVNDLVIDQFIRNNWNDNKLVPKKSGHFNVNLRTGRLEAYRSDDIANVSELSYMKTKGANNTTYLWKRISADKNSVVFQLLKPLGNNGEYIEMSTSELLNPLTNNTQTSEDIQQETSQLKQDSPAETESQESPTSVVSESAVNAQTSKYIETIMAKRNKANVSTTKEQATELFETMKQNPKRYEKFINTIFKEMNIDVDIKKSNELFKKLC